MLNEKPILKSLEIIENRILEKLTVENLASSVHFSKYHYQRLFREIVGDTVMEYVTKRKLTLAGKSLLETNDTVLNIALKYGFDSHDGFTRSFKAYMGVTPSQYRNYEITRQLLLFIMTLIVIVAAVNVSSSVSMLVLERQRDIAILKTAVMPLTLAPETFNMAISL